MSETLELRNHVDYDARPLAEDLALEVSLQAFNHYMTRKNPAGHFNSAWCHYEYAMNQEADLDNDIRLKYIEDAQSLIGGILKNPKSTEDIKLGALTLSSYAVCMGKRAIGESISSQDCLDVYSSLGSAMAYMLPIDECRPSWRMAETVALALSARVAQPDKLLYPSSPRDESTVHSNLNHDGYFINNGVKKCVQQKFIHTDKIYSGDVSMLILLPLVEKAYKRYGRIPPAYVDQKLNELIELVVSESIEGIVSREKRNTLNFLSRAVVHHSFNDNSNLNFN